MVEDRQNEQIYAMRSNQKSVSPQYFYRLHIANYEKCVEENLKDVLSNFQDSSSNCVSLLWGRIKSYFDSWLIKTNVSDEGLDKFKEQNSDNLTEYKTSSTVIPYSLDFLSPVNLHCYNLENAEDLNLIITDIENAKVDFKTVNLEWDTLWEYGGVSILEKILNVAKMRNIDLELFMLNLEKLVNFYIENGSLEGFKLLCEYESQVNWSKYGLSTISATIIDKGLREFTNEKFQNIWRHANSIKELHADIQKQIESKLNDPSYEVYKDMLNSMKGGASE